MRKKLERTGLAGESMMLRCPLSMSFLNSPMCFCNVIMVLVSSSDMLFGVDDMLCTPWPMTDYTTGGTAIFFSSEDTRKG
jgi:hypothetical protein